ncbi:hypothetical protein LCGC14_0814190 [marine sediment metagenome]|uniref:Uncharacterized protein n=1 Tax=marine sediment metagenome TaxID=412755 RepID=A0A0F9S5P6_9ZZZZ
MKLEDIKLEDLGKYALPYYLEVSKWDIVSKLQPLFENGTLFLREDGKIDHVRKPIWHPPWAFIQHMGKDCFLYHKIYFTHWKRIHSECQKCWKVVCEPRTLDELFQLYHVQRKLNYPSKCGAEVSRENSSKKYGGYFYCNRLDEGQKRYEEVKGLLPDMPVILKRACTEYEQELGDSKDWEITPEQEEEEWILRDSFVNNVVDYSQARHLIAHLHKFWIHTAYQMGDETYLNYTGGNKLFPDLRTYHNG